MAAVSKTAPMRALFVMDKWSLPDKSDWTSTSAVSLLMQGTAVMLAEGLGIAGRSDEIVVCLVGDSTKRHQRVLHAKEHGVQLVYWIDYPGGPDIESMTFPYHGFTHVFASFPNVYWLVERSIDKNIGAAKRGMAGGTVNFGGRGIAMPSPYDIAMPRMCLVIGPRIDGGQVRNKLTKSRRELLEAVEHRAPFQSWLNVYRDTCTRLDAVISFSGAVTGGVLDDEFLPSGRSRHGMMVKFMQAATWDPTGTYMVPTPSGRRTGEVQNVYARIWGWYHAETGGAMAHPRQASTCSSSSSTSADVDMAEAKSPTDYEDLRSAWENMLDCADEWANACSRFTELAVPYYARVTREETPEWKALRAVCDEFRATEASVQHGSTRDALEMLRRHHDALLAQLEVVEGKYRTVYVTVPSSKGPTWWGSKPKPAPLMYCSPNENPWRTLSTVCNTVFDSVQQAEEDMYSQRTSSSLMGVRDDFYRPGHLWSAVQEGVHAAVTNAYMEAHRREIASVAEKMSVLEEVIKAEDADREAAAASREASMAAVQKAADAFKDALEDTPMEETATSPLGICVVCDDAPRTHAITPCGHVVYCAACAEFDVKLCPICRGPVVTKMQLFVS